MEIINKDKWVLITGANSGIGKATTELLSAQGFKVYACARHVEDLNELRALKAVFPLKLDVTNDTDVQTAFETVQTQNTGLYAIINNAGIGVVGPLMDISLGDFEKQLAVNLIGVHRVTKTFFPLLLASSGRIIMISSGVGLAAPPFSGAYAASKSGLEAYTDALRRELMLISNDLKVCIIEPGIVKTPIWKKNDDYCSDLTQSLFKNAVAQWRKIDKSPYETGKKSLDPTDIAQVILKALRVKHPKIRYFATERNWWYQLILHLPEVVKDRALKFLISRQRI